MERDPDAWESLYRRSYRSLFGFARRPLFDEQAAEDAVSETMIRALDNIDRFSWQGAGFDAWLYGIARNVVYEFARARQRTVVLVDDERPAIDAAPRSTQSPATRRRRCAGPSTADPEEREVLELRVHSGLSSEEVGRLLGKQAGAVRMAQARALQRLRMILEEVRGAH